MNTGCKLKRAFLASPLFLKMFNIGLGYSVSKNNTINFYEILQRKICILINFEQTSGVTKK